MENVLFFKKLSALGPGCYSGRREERVEGSRTEGGEGGNEGRGGDSSDGGAGGRRWWAGALAAAGGRPARKWEGGSYGLFGDPNLVLGEERRRWSVASEMAVGVGCRGDIWSAVVVSGGTEMKEENRGKLWLRTEGRETE